LFRRQLAAGAALAAPGRAFARRPSPHAARARHVAAPGHNRSPCEDALTPRPPPTTPAPPQGLGTVDVVINTAALSQPALCEQDYAYARSVNVPDALISALVRQKRTKHVDALLIHISTDQVGYCRRRAGPLLWAPRGAARL
jgi:hypothetical protein